MRRISKELNRVDYHKIISNLLLLISFSIFALIMGDFFYPIQTLGVIFLVLELVFYFIGKDKATDVFYILKYITFIFSYLVYVLIMLLKGIPYLFSPVSLVHIFLLVFVIIVFIVDGMLRKKFN